MIASIARRAAIFIGGAIEIVYLNLQLGVFSLKARILGLQLNHLSLKNRVLLRRHRKALAENRSGTMFRDDPLDVLKNSHAITPGDQVETETIPLSYFADNEHKAWGLSGHLLPEQVRIRILPPNDLPAGKVARIAAGGVEFHLSKEDCAHLVRLLQARMGSD